MAGFKRWLGLGYAVRRGERGLSIWAPCPPSKKKLRTWREAGGNPLERPQTYFRLAKVFDTLPGRSASRVSRRPRRSRSPDRAGRWRQPRGSLRSLRDFATTIGYTVAVEAVTGSALGYCTPQRAHIGVETVSESFSSNAQVAFTSSPMRWFESTAGEGDPDLAYASEEVVVECVAYTVCSTVGLNTSGWSVPYMATWGAGSDIARYGELIDRLARRLEDAVIGGACPAGEEVGAAA